ncbi:MAG TPA: PDGLE domain-containing protein, partial [Verrucomicrobiae bacterium]|nr:PDGLE domain-containing protein [Verrucomicrobiae bacterium]
GTVAWSVAFPAMTNVHMLIGVGEALITTLVVVAIQRTRPELIEPTQQTGGVLGYKQVLGYGLLISLGLALFVSPFACPWPDGLEKVAGALGFAHRAVGQPLLSAPIPDYHLAGIKSAILATSLAGVMGTIIVFALSFLLARLLVPQIASTPRSE